MNEYIEEAFTREGENTNLEVNNLNATCITSNNNKFNLDSEGNLTVRSLTTEITSVNNIEIFPIGSIYLSVSSANPSTIFGGTWEQIKDKFLLACGDIYENGETGGEANVTLTTAQLPKHTHKTGIAVNPFYSSGNNGDWNQPAYIGDGNGRSSGIAGGDQPHNNMPPYLTVYMWKRIA